MQHFHPDDSLVNGGNFSFNVPLLAHSERRKPSQLLIPPEQYFQPYIAAGDNPNEKSEDSLIIEDRNNGGFKKIRLKKKAPLKVEKIKLKIVEEKLVEPLKPSQEKFIKKG